MTACKPHFFNVCHCFGFCIQCLNCRSCHAWVQWAVILWPLLQGIPWLLIHFWWSCSVRQYHVLGLKWLVYDIENPILQWWRKYLPTRDAHQETKCDGSTWYHYPPEWMAANEVYNARTLIWRDRSNTDHTLTNSISTLIENARLKAMLCSCVIYILYVKGTCWWLHIGKRLICWIWQQARLLI